VDLSIVITLVGAILGTGLIVGGIVVLRNARGTGSRAFGAVAVAVGVVLWAFILFITPIAVVQGG
jgi:hypothetical protein